MKIAKKIEEKKLTIFIDGRLDTLTAPMLEDEINNIQDEIKVLELDFSKLEYVSSSGLRVILSAQKLMNKKGSMKILNINDTVKEILEMTGFLDILDVE